MSVSSFLKTALSMRTTLYKAYRAKKEAVATWLSAPMGCAVSRSTWLRLGSIFGPLALLVVLMRLLQYSITVRTGLPPLGPILLSAAVTPLLLLLTSVATYIWSRARWPHLRAVWHFVGVCVLTVLSTIGTSLLAPSWITEWLTPSAFEAIRWDMLLLLTLALTFLFLLEQTRGWMRFASLVVLYALAPFLMFIPAGSFAYFVTTGSFADVTLLTYFLRHIPDLLDIVSSELRGPRVILSFLPLLIVIPPLLLLRVRAVRRWVYAAPSQSASGLPWHVLAVSIPLILLLALPPRTTLPDIYPPSSYVSVMERLAAPLPTRSHTTPRLDTAPFDPPFDSRNLVLARTDSSRSLNVVMIILESTRARSTTPYTPLLDTTPFLDSLAHHALLVEQMYAVVPYTNKSLTPLLAGIYPYPHRALMAARPGGLPGRGLPELLKPHGYKSAFFSPARLSYERKDQILLNLGFDEMHGGDTLHSEGFARTNYFGSEDRIVLAPSMDWVDARVTAAEPFFLSYLTLVAHHPYDVPPTFETRNYGSEDAALNDYLNAIRYTDGFLRDLFAAFAERNLLESTLFIITGDHGQAFGEHQQRMHADVLWDEVLHVPTLLYSPALFPEPGRITGPRQQIDFLPTVADALNMTLHGGFLPGQSLLQNAQPGRSLYFSGWESDIVLALRQGGQKYICRYKRCAMQVFDTDRDPKETQNLATRLAPEHLQAAENRMRQWRRNVRLYYEEHFRRGDTGGSWKLSTRTKTE